MHAKAITSLINLYSNKTPLQSLQQSKIIAALLLKCYVWQAAISGRIPDNRVNCSAHLIKPQHPFFKGLCPLPAWNWVQVYTRPNESRQWDAPWLMKSLSGVSCPRHGHIETWGRNLVAIGRNLVTWHSISVSVEYQLRTQKICTVTIGASKNWQILKNELNFLTRGLFVLVEHTTAEL